MNEFLSKIYIKVSDLGNKHYLKFAGAAVGVMALVWWCVFYPELCFPRDTYEAVYESQENEALGILQADDEQIVFKSKLFEWLSNKID